MNTRQQVGMVSVGAYAPPGTLTNADLEKIVETSDEWIRTRTGIANRHIAGEEIATSDVILPAAQLALERAHLAPTDLDLIVVGTITSDHTVPSTACIVQHRLGASHAAAFDLTAACTGFVYSASVASSMISTGQVRNALIVGGDTLSKFTDYTDRSTCVLLGDGAGAAVLKPVPEGRGFLSFYLRADGSGAESLIVPAGGSREPASLETVNNRRHYIRMSGNEIFKFAVRVIEESIVTALDRAGLTVDDVAYVIPHQANSRIIDAAAKRVSIPVDRWVCNISEYGNTSAASIPMALNEVYGQGRIHEGDVIVMVGFGGGLTWGATVLRW